MPIKKDESGKRWVEMELVLPGTPEQLWQAFATGAGYRGWFAKTEIDGRVGGKVQFDFGDGTTSAGEVTEWQPPQRFGYVERDWDKDAPPVATEITITARSGDRCQVRMVHSLFTSEDSWDDQLENFESGWPSFFEILRLYLLHFSGVPAASFMAMAPSNKDAISSWKQLGEALGLGGADVGERRTSPSGPERWSGTVEHVHQDGKYRYVLLRLDAPSPGIAAIGTYDKSGNGDSASVSVVRYFYGEDAEEVAARQEPAWREWLKQTFGGEQKPAE
jgi:uncharacterized protein YndB with AHSA1/START domain